MISNAQRPAQAQQNAGHIRAKMCLNVPHNPEVAGSNPAPATILFPYNPPEKSFPFLSPFYQPYRKLGDSNHFWLQMGDKSGKASGCITKNVILLVQKLF